MSKGATERGDSLDTPSRSVLHAQEKTETCNYILDGGSLPRGTGSNLTLSGKTGKKTKGKFVRTSVLKDLLLAESLKSVKSIEKNAGKEVRTGAKRKDSKMSSSLDGILGPRTLQKKG